MGLSNTKPVREGFDPKRPEPNPLSGQDAQLCLDAAEKIDGYRAKVAASKVNIKARKSQSYTAAANAVGKPITIAQSPWWTGQVLWMDATADAGLPHTRPPGYICLPENIAVTAIESTLLHERIHLHQRRYPNIWNQFFQEKWNMVPWSEPLPKELEDNRRLNPDLLPFPFFIWRDTWIPLAIYDDPGNPSLSKASTVWYNVKQKVSSRLPPEGWKEFFGAIVNDEHPWEIAAYYIQDKSLKSPAKDILMQLVPKLPNTYL